MFPLEIEFEDSELFAETVNGADVDMHQGDDNAGAREDQTDEAGRERSNGSGPVAQLPETGSRVEPAPPPSVPKSTLRFGSFEPASAPPRLWSDRVDSDDVFEHTLPLLEFEGAGGSLPGPMVTASLPRTLVGAGDVEPLVASPPPVPLVVEVPEMMSTPEWGLGEGSRGRWPRQLPSFNRHR